ncbi:MAG: hypothetical protein K6F75_01370 [Butyrivibrio sp.]|nr:hypothetical protein [Butyrivibrio sp.]
MFNVLDYGAVGDGKTLDSPAIQKALDECEENGGGTIDGTEEIYYGNVTRYHIEGAYYPRTPLLFIENVEHFTITNVTLTHSAFWTLHMVGCRDVLVDSVRILNNLKMANCDGIDPDHCQNVRINNCYIESADDCIVFKTSEAYEGYGPVDRDNSLPPGICVVIYLL